MSFQKQPLETSEGAWLPALRVIPGIVVLTKYLEVKMRLIGISIAFMRSDPLFLPKCWWGWDGGWGR